MDNTSSLPRAATARRGFVVALAASLAGCGFELRKAPIFAFKSISVPGSSIFVNTLRRQLRAQGTVEVVAPELQSTAEAIVDVLSEARDNLVLSTNAAGQVREFQLRFTLRFRVRTPAGKDILGPTEIQQTRDITYNETSALAKEGETELLYRDMQTDIAQQALRRLAAIKSL